MRYKNYVILDRLNKGYLYAIGQYGPSEVCYTKYVNVVFFKIILHLLVNYKRWIFDGAGVYQVDLKKIKAATYL